MTSAAPSKTPSPRSAGRQTTPRLWNGSPLAVESHPMADADEPLYAKLKLHVDDEHRVVIIGTPDGLDALDDDQILLLLRRASELSARYRAAGYAVTRWDSQHPRRQP